MTDVTELIAALVAIAKDPKAWEKRIDDMNEAAGNLREARKLKSETEEAQKAAAADLETARYERGQAERATRDATAQATVNAQRERALHAQEEDLNRRKNAFEADAQNSKANLEGREKDLDTRERLAAKKLNDAQKLLAAYDEAKHQAALKLAG
jgi:hypothetical protein